MTIIYRCTLELHDSLYFATREIGRLYETEPIVHNYALSYALGLIDSDRYNTTVTEEHSYRYFCPEQIPKYEEHLTPLNQQGIYVTPAKVLNYASVLNTWKYANNNYHVEMEPTSKNIPGFGRTKEIAAESRFEFFIITEKSLQLARWMRLGKWASKGELTIEELEHTLDRDEEFVCTHPLNPLDVMFTNRVMSFDTVNMPPVSLIRNVRMRGDCYRLKGLNIPAKMQYRFRG
ncbi:type I-D CRISPR-associated protein Cas5/Csc1 [Chamaesiphon polymorphus]|uniref:Type I-D CRISPR-associated protein Cas5/Csc1 n=1 Tax=Chamaesiphon polymorphus CCALA 037 TaxID=2107692 RepID=A0A2T1GAV1_9CYAN|nr:type I-D CRISPR-associated protein Cas5/Csc1 [Chamaesiphon polymorphus]PSB54394.1 type I-D CRISPR-associated protein Cas5/Csc1 [Chamaesiphon polymorphus CCALA 037]